MATSPKYAEVESLDRAEKELQEVDWREFKRSGWLPGHAIQPQAKFILYKVGVEEGFQVYSEFKPQPSSVRNYRIDVGWFEPQYKMPVAGFEIDKTVSEHSVEKLQELPDYTERVIVSKSDHEGKVNYCKENYVPSDFHHIDVKRYRE